MSDNIGISVIVPIYNVKEYLEECLCSLERQTLKNIEVILVNDGSADGSKEIAQAFAQKHENFILIHRQNGGLSAARNTGLEQATGQYIYFLDSDDFLADNALERLYKRAKHDDLDVLKFSAYTFKNHSSDFTWTSDKGYKYKGIYDGVYLGNDILRLFIKKQDIFPSCCLILIKKDILDKNNLCFHEGIIHEDELFHYELLALSQRVGVLNEPLYYRRIRPGSITQSSDWIKENASFCIIAEELDAFLEKHPQLQNSAIHWQIMACINRILWNWESNMTVRQQFSHQTDQCLSRVQPLVKKYVDGGSKSLRLLSASPRCYRICKWIATYLKKILRKKND